MKLREVILKNFKGYYRETRLPIDDLTALIGKNDVGKSTILEALDVFFNKTKIDSNQRNILHPDEETIIGCIFDDFPASITLEDVETSLSKEYLLNEHNLFEIWKRYPSNEKQTIWIRANHPSNEGFNDLLSKKNNDLKTKIIAAGLRDQVNLTVNSEMRSALWASLGDSLRCEITFISADQADEKKLWPKIEPFLPAYRIFKADRASTDEDAEAQDPMQQAIKIAIEAQSAQLNHIAEEVQKRVSEVATETVKKLREFDKDLADELTPSFKKTPAWEKAFSFSLTGDNAIPINSRGSGIRRLVLFSFFRAANESDLFDKRDIIYAVEEPETSQHPDAQRMIVRTLLEMSEKGHCQVIITTHVPGLAGSLPLKSLRYITNGEGYPEIAYGDQDTEMLNRIADTLGVYPDFAPALAPHHGVKLIICLEGPNDIAFISAISRIAHQANNDIVDLNASPDIIMLPLGGSDLKDWVNYNYLQKLGTPEFHIYDSDNTGSHASERDRVNLRTDGSSARLTKKREMENYIHSQVVQELFGINIDITDTMDVSTEISKKIRETNPTGYNPGTVKKKLNHAGAQKMTLDLLKERDPDDEVLGWLQQISEFVQSNRS